MCVFVLLCSTPVYSFMFPRCAPPLFPLLTRRLPRSRCRPTKELFARKAEVGRVCLISYGPNTGKLCTIVDIIDANRVRLLARSLSAPRRLFARFARGPAPCGRAPLAPGRGCAARRRSRAPPSPFPRRSLLPAQPPLTPTPPPPPPPSSPPPLQGARRRPRKADGRAPPHYQLQVAAAH